MSRAEWDDFGDLIIRILLILKKKFFVLSILYVGVEGTQIYFRI